jgi:P-type Mg2+ transporter
MPMPANLDAVATPGDVALDTSGCHDELRSYWSVPLDRLLERLGSRPSGLTSAEAAFRLRRFGPNRIRHQAAVSRLRVLASQFKSPLLLLLLLAAIVSGLAGEWLDAAIVLVIVAASAGVGYWREYAAQSAAAILERRLRIQAAVLRDGRLSSLPIEDLVPGDLVELAAGNLVPGDGVLLDPTDLFVSEAVLTGESFAVEKHDGVSPAAAPIRERRNCVFLGTHVTSGCARCLIVRTGLRTKFGAIADRLVARRPPTEFDRGIQRFGYLLTTAMLVLIVVVFLVHVMNGRPATETLLFAVALAVGLSPELLPAILNVNLARGANAMARAGVLVRRLTAIEDLGSMDVLCTDKTGTLTEGVVRVDGAYNPSGTRSPAVLRLAAINASLRTGVPNPLDEAIVAEHHPALDGLEKLSENPFDFGRRRSAVVVRSGDRIELIAKGAFPEVLQACTSVAGGHALDAVQRAALTSRHDAWTRNGIRVLAVAHRELQSPPRCARDAEHDMMFAGFLTFLDRPKPGVIETIRELASRGVQIKLITGDSHRVASHVAAVVGLRADAVLTGEDLHRLDAHALWHAVDRTDVFAEVDPIQKERIIRALRSAGHVVGFLGDGANDAPAMHAADTSLSVMEAVDVARAAADFVLLERDLAVIGQGIEEGRKTFANTLKYILTTTSANLGNMVSMAVASIFLPFLPLTAGQILLNNFLSDMPAVGLADDAVDRELVERPQRWNMGFIGRFMTEFGLLSSAFDALTFAIVLACGAGVELFRTAWFVESLLTELAIALVVRTRRPFYRSRPGTILWVATAVLVVVAFAMPYVGAMQALGFTPMPASLVVVIRRSPPRTSARRSLPSAGSSALPKAPHRLAPGVELTPRSTS